MAIIEFVERDVEAKKVDRKNKKKIKVKKKHHRNKKQFNNNYKILC